MSATRRSGTWVYGEHPGLNPGWRYLDTPLVLDFDASNHSASVPGCYAIWVNGHEREAIDHYLDGSMDWIENHLSDYLPAASSSAGGEQR